MKNFNIFQRAEGLKILPKYLNKEDGRPIKKGEIITYEEMEGYYLYIFSGSLAIVIQPIDDLEVVLDKVLAGGFILNTKVENMSPYLKFLEDSSVLLMTYSEVFNLVRNDCALFQEISIHRQEVMSSYQNQLALARIDAPRRLLAMVNSACSYFPRKNLDDPYKIYLKYPHAEFAEYINISYRAYNRIFHMLKEKGIADIRGKYLYVYRRKALIKLIESEEKIEY